MTYGDLEHRCDPGRAALVLVDVQVDFCCGRDDGTPRRASSAMEAAATRLVGLVAAAHVAEVPVVFVQTVHDEASDASSWRSRRGTLAPYERELCKPDTEGVEFYKVSPGPSDHVVRKHRYDAFVGSDLDALLRSLGRESVIGTGMMTDICVETTMRHALCLDYLTTTVGDCCAAGNDEQHASALERLARSFGLVANAAEVAAVWGVELAPVPAVLEEAPAR